MSESEQFNPDTLPPALRLLFERVKRLAKLKHTAKLKSPPSTSLGQPRSART